MLGLLVVVTLIATAFALLRKPENSEFGKYTGQVLQSDFEIFEFNYGERVVASYTLPPVSARELVEEIGRTRPDAYVHAPDFKLGNTASKERYFVECGHLQGCWVGVERPVTIKDRWNAWLSKFRR